MWDQVEKGNVPYSNGNAIELGTRNPAAAPEDTAVTERNGFEPVGPEKVPVFEDKPPPSYDNTML